MAAPITMKKIILAETTGTSLPCGHDVAETD